jgi:hypothetical protein
MRQIVKTSDVQQIKSTTTDTDNIATGIEVDDYKTRLLKLIPTEIIAAYVAIDSVLKGNIVALQAANIYEKLSWIVFGLLFILTPIYLKAITKVNPAAQIIFSTIAFGVWVLTLGGPFIFVLGNLTYILGSIILVFYTLIIPFVYK